MIIEFLIAFLGIIYFATRIGGEKAQKIAIEHNRDQLQLAYEEWKGSVTDISLEESLSLMITNPARYNEVWGEVYKAYLQMPSRKNMSGVAITPDRVTSVSKRATKQRENIASAMRREVLRILMARQGKIPVSDASQFSSLGRVYAEANRDFSYITLAEEQYELMCWLQNEMQRFHPNMSIVAKPMTDSSGTAIPLHEVRTTSSGVIHWRGHHYTWRTPYDQ